MYNLGFDISTSVIGISLFLNDKFIDMTYIDISKEKDFFLKCKKTKDKINNFFEEHNLFDKEINIYIEDILQSFSNGLSSAKTIVQLARFNGIVSYMLYDLSGFLPVYLNVNSARKLLGIKIDKNSKKDKKEQVLEWVDKDMSINNIEFKWQTKIISRGVNKGCVKLEKFCYDMADAYVICKAGITNDLRDNKKI